MKEEIKNILSEYIEETILFNGAKGSIIKGAEEVLGKTFPEDYKEFLKEYGAGGAFGFYISGLESSNLENTSLYNNNMKMRKYNLPDDYLIIVDCDEFYYCFDISLMDENQKCPVVTWSPYQDKSEPSYSSFEELFLTYLNDGIDNI